MDIFLRLPTIFCFQCRRMCALRCAYCFNNNYSVSCHKPNTITKIHLRIHNTLKTPTFCFALQVQFFILFKNWNSKIVRINRLLCPNFCHRLYASYCSWEIVDAGDLVDWHLLRLVHSHVNRFEFGLVRVCQFYVQISQCSLFLASIYPFRTDNSSMWAVARHRKRAKQKIKYN